MPTIKDVHNFVKEEMIGKSDVKYHLHIINFLESLLGSTNENCKKLLICMGIDIRTYKKRFTSSSVEFEDYLSQLIEIIFDSQEYPVKLKTATTLTPSINFAIQLRKHFAKCNPKITVLKSENYFRVVSFGGFIDWIIKDNFDYNISVLPADFDYNEKRRYYDEFKDGVRFNELTIKKLGSGNGWVYIGNKLDFNTQLSTRDLLSILDSIGYYVESAVIDAGYVYLDYPGDFEETTYQPCTITGDWGNVNFTREDEIPGNDFFIPYIDCDCWGRAFSVSGTKPEVKERAHRNEMFTKEYKFKILDLGILKTGLKKGPSEGIINEALKRFENAC